MNILGFNPNHHGSVCLLQDGELKFFIQEERVGNRDKYIAHPFRSFIDLLQNYTIDHIVWSSPSITYPVSSTDSSPFWQEIAYTYHPNVKYWNLSDRHHYIHASHSFYNSGFKKAIGVVIDGLGSNFKDWGQETESIFDCSYPSSFKLLYVNVYSTDSINTTSYIENFYRNANVSTNINLSRLYENITMYLGWDRNEAGKTMGLASYGKFNQSFPPFFKNKNGNPDVFMRSPYSDGLKICINEKNYPQLKLSRDPKEWHYDESKITDLEKDLAWHIQNDTQQIVGDYIEKAIEETGLKQVCCAGGYFLNCVTNYYLKKRFPDVEFYFEPISNDAGTAIGAAKLLWHEETQDTTIRPFKSLYLGKEYSKDELLKGISKYVDK